MSTCVAANEDYIICSKSCPFAVGTNSYLQEHWKNHNFSSDNKLLNNDSQIEGLESLT